MRNFRLRIEDWGLGIANPTSHIPNPKFSRRRGMSILEVLFAILITAIGLLGAIAILPVASTQAGRGRTLDAAAVSGQTAIHMFDARDLRKPSRWIGWNQGWDNSATPPAPQYLPVTSISCPNRTAFCIDPRFVAANSSIPQQANLFPSILRTNAEARMFRVSIDRMQISSGALATTGQALTQIMADSLFVFGDDLTYERPRDLAANQIFDVGPSATTPTKRQTEGLLSWMATVVPKMERYTTVPNDLFVLSVVVFHQRPAGMPMDGTTERVLKVLDMPGLGVTGGEVVLTAANTADLKLRPGDWLMLSGSSRQNLGGGNFRDDHDFKWYRVVDCDTEPTVGSTAGSLGYDLYVSLMGQDWNLQFGTPGGSPANAFPQATIVEGVVGVYEKTIRLDLGQN